MVNKKLRAKFKNKTEQKIYFRKVKNKLGLGSRKISRLLGLKSRGMIESYSLGRTSPRLDILKQIEKTSKIKAEYSIVKGFIKIKKRGLMPLKYGECVQILESKKLFSIVKGLAKEGKKIISIIKILREKGFNFDNSSVSRAIGTYKKSLIIKEKEKIHGSNCIILKGNIFEGNSTLRVSFNLFPLKEILKSKKIYIGYEIDYIRENIKIFPLLNMGNRINFSKNTIFFQISKHLNINNSKINIILNPKDFGLNKLDSIQDEDGKILAEEALNRGIFINSRRITSNSYRGDLVLKINGINLLIEITRSRSRQVSRFKIGQCTIAKVNNPNDFLILICYPNLFSEKELKTLKWLKIYLVETDFKEGWSNKTLDIILREVQY